MTEHSPALHEPFESIARQREAASFGLWIFLATEILFFGSLFLSLTIYKSLHLGPMTEAARQTNVVYGSVNTAVLLTSSLTMAVVDRFAEIGRKRVVLVCLAATALLGLAFLVIKGFEYHEDIVEHLVPGPGFKLPDPAAQIFFSFYWVMTGIHALHLTIGIVLMGILWWLVWSERLAWQDSAALQTAGLYWHFVDLVWIFLYPLLYLTGRT